MILRFERWGAWAKLETTPAVVALDQEAVRALGLDGGDAWRPDAPRTPPLEVHVAVTSRCAAGCEGCYLDARPDGVEPPREEIEATFDALAAAGVFTVAFGGGEPTLREDLAELAEAARARGLTPVVTTSGLGLGDKKLDRLRAFAQVNVSYDGSADAYASVRGFDGSESAERAIRRLTEAGVTVGVNIVLTRDTFEAVPATIRRVAALGAKEVQLLRYKPAGRAKTLDYLAKRLSRPQSEQLGPLLRALAEEHAASGLHVRIDCALVPFLSADETLASRPEVLAQWGVFGCEAGDRLASTRVDGHLAPCSFAESTALHAMDIARGWADEDGFAPFRDYTRAPPEPCASCTLRPVCKGGCKIVSSFTTSDDASAPAFGPDPECPRVYASASARDGGAAVR